jgi:hypothetical protein
LKFKGDVRGYLRVKIEPISPNETAHAKAGTIRQSARLNFRKEDFLHRRNTQKPTNKNSNTLSSDYASSENGNFLKVYLLIKIY